MNVCMGNMCSDFLPSERADAETIATQHQSFAHSRLWSILDKIPIFAVMLNECRQIVFYNKAFGDFLGLPPEEILGKRPGEALGCEYYLSNPGGCGTSRSCRYCGAAKAILKSLNNMPDVQECNMTRNGQQGSINLQVWSTPYIYENEHFVMLSLLDVYHEKMMALYQQFFFHDILNIAGGIKNLAEILREEVSGDLRTDMDTLSTAALRMLDNIRAQKELASAENNTLRVTPVKMGSMMVLKEVVTFFEKQNVARNKNLVIREDATDEFLESDNNLLNRVMVNLVKNALEASGSGDTVTLGCRTADGVAEFTVHNLAVMTEESLVNVFKRLYSTKGIGRGLGAYIVKLLVTRYLQGEVSCTSEAESGTTFTVRIPLSLTTGSV